MIALLLSLSLSAFAQSTEDQTELKILEQLESRFREPPRFGLAPTVKPARGNFPEPRTSREAILASPLVQKALRQPAQIEELKSGDFTITKRAVLLQVHALTDSEGFHYVRNASGELTHRVSAAFLEDVKPITAMAEEPLSYSPISERKNISPFDAAFDQRLELGLSYGVASANWTSDVLRDTAARSASGYQIGARWLAEFRQRFLLGFTANLEQWSYRSSSAEVGYQNVGVGVIAKSRQFEAGGFPWRVFVEGRLSPFGTLSLRAPGLDTDLALRTASLVLGWERSLQNRFGPWSWGVAWQRDWPRLRTRDELVAQKTSVQNNDFFALHVTQGLAW